MENQLTYLTKQRNVATNTVIVAKQFNKQHKHVLEAAKKLVAENSAAKSMFIESSYVDGRGKNQPMMIMDRDGFSLLAMGFTGKEALKFKLDFIEQFKKMEHEIKNKVLPISNLDKLVQISTNLVSSQQEVKVKLEDNTSRIEHLENTMTIDSHEAKHIHDLGQSLALKAMGGKSSNAYMKIGHKVFSRLWRSFNNHFDISTYKDLEKVKKNEAMYWLPNMWHLDMDLQDEVEALNKQTDLDI